MLVHGGMAQNVGPILEMVTEKYLLRCEAEWDGRQAGDRDPRSRSWRRCERERCPAIGAATTRNFFGPLQTIIPWATNFYTETLIDRVKRRVRRRFLGLLDAGRHVRRRDGLHLRPDRKAEAQEFLQEIDGATKRELRHALPFAMEPVVYDFAINPTRHVRRSARAANGRCCRRAITR